MKENLDQSAAAAEARRLAEERLQRQAPADGAPPAEADAARLLHELQVHQIELEMQNKALQQARAEAEARLAQYTELYDFAPSGYLTLDRSGSILKANLTAARLLGVERARLMERPLGQFLAEGSRRALGDLLHRVLGRDTRESCEVEVPQAGAQALVLRLEGVRTPDGQECRLVLLDITERNTLRTVLDNLPDLVFIKDREGRVQSCNAAAAQFMGWSEAEMRGKSVFDLNPLELAQGYQEDDLRVLREGVTLCNHEEQIRDHTGVLHWHLTTKAPLRDQAGRINGLVAICYNITERKQAEAALKESEAQFRAMFELASIGMAQADPRTGQWLRVNQKMCAITGYRADELLEMRVSEITHPDDRPQDWELFQRVIRGETPDYRLEKRYVRKDGSTAWVNVNMTVIRDAAGQPVRTMATIEDISERKQAEAAHALLEAQLRQSQKMEVVGQLAGGVAHDFNNILTVIVMQGEEARADQTLSPDTREALVAIQRAAESATSLTRQLLLFSRRQIMQPQRLDLNDVVTSLSKMLRRTLGENIQFQLNLCAQPLWTQADPGMMDQVVMNLAVNARDAMPAGGRLTIGTAAVTLDTEQAGRNPAAAPGRYGVLTVQDTGSGIPPEILPHIFEPFFTTKDVGKGTGLGLATVFGIVKQHGGWIEVESPPGQGSTFRIYLPATETAAAAQPAEAAKPKAPGGTETILLVEDDPTVRKITTQALQRQGYRVLAAEHGPAALALSREPGLVIDLLLTDLMMPEDLDGRQLAAQLLAQRPGLKVIFMSGYSAELAGRELALLPGQEFIQKPCSRDHLLATLRCCLDNPI